MVSIFINCPFLVTVHGAIYISMPSSLVKMSVKLLQLSQSPSLSLFTMIFFMTLVQQWSKYSVFEVPVRRQVM